MLGQIVNAVWGGVTALLILAVAFYRSRALAAEKLNVESIQNVNSAFKIKEDTETAFKQAKEFFDKQLAKPISVLVSDEQIDQIGNKLAAKQFAAGGNPRMEM